MENKNIIIIFVAIVIVLAVIAGAMFLQSGNAKEPTKVKITSDKEQYGGGKLSIKLSDLNKTPISKEIVNIKVTNKKGKVVVDEVVKTNSKGKAKIDLNLKKGKYVVNVNYSGNENYTGCNTTQKLKIKEKVDIEESTNDNEQIPQEEPSSSSNEIYYDEEINVYYDSSGIIVDPDGQHGQSVGYSYDDLREARDKWERGELEM